MQPPSPSCLIRWRAAWSAGGLPNPLPNPLAGCLIPWPYHGGGSLTYNLASYIMFQWTSTCTYYIYDPSAWTPNSLFNAIIVLQSFCNLCFAIFCYAIFAILQSLLCNCCYAILAMQSLLCNLCYAIFTMQSLLCNLCYAIFAFLSLQVS